VCVVVVVVVVGSGGGGAAAAAAAAVWIFLLCTPVSMCILINCENNKELFSFMVPIPPP
jgi:hypothetical protein